MEIVNKSIEIDTKGAGDFLNITEQVMTLIRASKVENGSVTVFVVGSTAGITTFEYEPGMVQDMRDICERLVPSNKHYSHDETWGDANGFSHLRAALYGPSLVVPIVDQRAVLGTWQQIVLAEFDNRPRHREVIVQITGE